MTDLTPPPAPRPAAAFPAMPALLALIIFALVATALVIALLTGDTDTARGLVDTLKNLAMIVAGFYFGSSVGSRAKDGALRPGGQP